MIRLDETINQSALNVIFRCNNDPVIHIYSILYQLPYIHAHQNRISSIRARIVYQHIDRTSQNHLHFFGRESTLFSNRLNYFPFLFLITRNRQESLQPDVGVDFEIFNILQIIFVFHSFHFPYQKWDNYVLLDVFDSSEQNTYPLNRFMQIAAYAIKDPKVQIQMLLRGRIQSYIHFLRYGLHTSAR